MRHLAIFIVSLLLVLSTGLAFGAENGQMSPEEIRQREQQKQQQMESRRQQQEQVLQQLQAEQQAFMRDLMQQDLSPDEMQRRKQEYNAQLKVRKQQLLQQQNGTALQGTGGSLNGQTTEMNAAKDPSTQPRKTSEEIEAYKAELRASKQGEIDAVRQAAQEMKSATGAERERLRCQIASEAVGTHAEQYDQMGKGWTERYRQLQDKLNQMSMRLESEGLDTTQLQLKVAKLSTMVKDQELNVDTYLNELERTRLSACGEPAQLNRQMQAAKTVREEIKSTSREISTYVKEEVRPELQALQTELQMKNGSALGGELLRGPGEQIKPTDLRPTPVQPKQDGAPVEGSKDDQLVPWPPEN